MERDSITPNSSYGSGFLTNEACTSPGSQWSEPSSGKCSLVESCRDDRLASGWLCVPSWPCRRGHRRPTRVHCFGDRLPQRHLDHLQPTASPNALKATGRSSMACCNFGLLKALVWVRLFRTPFHGVARKPQHQKLLSRDFFIPLHPFCDASNSLIVFQKGFFEYSLLSTVGFLLWGYKQLWRHLRRWACIYICDVMYY